MSLCIKAHGSETNKLLYDYDLGLLTQESESEKLAPWWMSYFDFCGKRAAGKRQNSKTFFEIELEFVSITMYDDPSEEND